MANIEPHPGYTNDGLTEPLDGPIDTEANLAALKRQAVRPVPHQHGQSRLPAGPRLDDVRWLYHSGFYDGPLNGRVLSASAGPVWAEVVEECGDGSCGFYRRYALIRLAAAADAEEARRQQLFQQHVGRHTVYDEDGRRDLSLVRPQEEWHAFYDACSSWPAWEPEGDVIGWFER
jgi:hypothetical protein